jgi:hypothetical protein
MGIDLEYQLGDIVRLKTDKEVLDRCVVRATISSAGVEYGLRHSDGDVTWHGAMEISNEEITKKKPGFK